MHITSVVDIYLSVSGLLVPVCPVCFCLCVILNHSTNKNHVIRVKHSVNLMHGNIKYTAITQPESITEDMLGYLKPIHGFTI